MATQTHLRNLLTKHSRLDQDIQKFETTAFFNDSKLHELKRKKLRIKEEIEKLRMDLPRQQ